MNISPWQMGRDREKIMRAGCRRLNAAKTQRTKRVTSNAASNRSRDESA